MRLALMAFIGVALASSAVLAASAFNFSTVSRTVDVQIVGDAAAYLAVAANGASAHDCFVSQTNGKLSIVFDSPDASCAANGGGTGINAGDGTNSAKYSRYAFHNLLLVTNKGTGTILLWANATTTSTANGQLIEAAKHGGSTGMGDSFYLATNGTGLSLGLASSAYVGVRVTSGTLTGGSVAGTIVLEARRT